MGLCRFATRVSRAMPVWQVQVRCHGCQAMAFWQVSTHRGGEEACGVKPSGRRWLSGHGQRGERADWTRAAAVEEQHGTRALRKSS